MYVCSQAFSTSAKVVNEFLSDAVLPQQDEQTDSAHIVSCLEHFEVVADKHTLFTFPEIC